MELEAMNASPRVMPSDTMSLFMLTSVRSLMAHPPCRNFCTSNERSSQTASMPRRGRVKHKFGDCPAPSGKPHRGEKVDAGLFRPAGTLRDAFVDAVDKHPANTAPSLAVAAPAQVQCLWQ